MITLTIDGKAITVPTGTTILQAAKQAGIAIPTLCHYDGITPPTSCFLCVVKIKGRKNLVPSCVAPAEEGVIVDSCSEEIREYRTRALELLLSEHAGDCEAPCQRICPCNMDIPDMARLIADGDVGVAIQRVKDKLPFPAILGYICPAPCQKGCRRGSVDRSISIRDLHAQVALADFKKQKQWLPDIHPSSGKKIAIVGTGPAGLSTAWYSAILGHQVTLFDTHDRPGGTLAFAISAQKLPPHILNHEVNLLYNLGISFNMNTHIGQDIQLEELEHDYHAVVLAIGAINKDDYLLHGLSKRPKGIRVEKGTFITSRPPVFACGAAIFPSTLAVRSMAQGRLTAFSIDRFLRNDSKTSRVREPFDSHLGTLLVGELEEFVTTSIGVHNTINDQSFPEDIRAESSRCLRCDCSKKKNCDLRQYAGEYQVNQRRYRSGIRRMVATYHHAGRVRYEPGKCISCGRCVGIVEAASLNPGISFVNRGFSVRVEAPFGMSLERAMGTQADACIAACPTGALSKIVFGKDKQ